MASSIIAFRTTSCLARTFALFLVVALAASASAGPVLRDFDGAERDLKEFTSESRWLVVMFWASDCHVCNAEARHYVDFHERHKDTGAAVLGVALDGYAGRDAARRFIERNALTFPNLIADAVPLQRWYEELTGEPFFGTPTFLIIAPGGAIAAKQAGAAPVALIENFIAGPN
jgi:peroxiredoxin